MKPAIAASFSRGVPVSVLDLLAGGQQQRPALGEELGHHRFLAAEVVVDEAVGDPRLVGDVGDAGRVVALAGEDADRGVEDRAALVDGGWAGLAVSGMASDPRSVGPTVGRGRRLASDGSSLPDALELAEVEVGDRDALALGRSGEDLAPGVDDHRVAPRVVVRRGAAVLVGGDHEELVLDRAGPQQRPPSARAPVDGGEGGRDRDHVRRPRAREPGRARGSAGRNRR